MQPTGHLEGEALDIPERMVVAPVTGLFEPLMSGSVTAGAHIQVGQTVGHIQQGTHRVEVTSPFAGVSRGLFTLPDERVRRFQPLLWMDARAVA